MPKDLTERNEKILSCHGKLTYKSIAKIFNISIENVRWIMLSNGRKFVRKSYSVTNINKEY